MAEQKEKKPPAKPKRLPKKYEPDAPNMKKCPVCRSEATRFVYQHLCAKDPNPDHCAVVTWEVPAYLEPQDKIRCPVCKDHTVKPILVKCGECARTTKP